jgi:hypothetical protein
MTPLEIILSGILLLFVISYLFNNVIMFKSDCDENCDNYDEKEKSSTHLSLVKLLLAIRWAEQKICLGQVDDNVQNMINALDKYTKSVLKKEGEEKLLSEVNDVLKLVEIDSGIPDLYKTISQEYN